MKFMKHFPLIFLAPALLMAGCSQSAQQAPTQVMLLTSASEIPQGTISLSTTLIRVKKKHAMAWKDVLPEWNPAKMVFIFQGDAPAVHDRIAARSDVSIEYTSTGTTNNGDPMPISVHRNSDTNDGGTLVNKGLDLTLIPWYQNVNGPINLRFSLNIQDERGSIQASQLMSLQQGKSLLISRIIDENTQEVLIVTPRIDPQGLPG